MSRAAIRSDLELLTKSFVLEAKPKVGYIYLENSTDKYILNEINEIKVGDVQSLPVLVDEETSIYEVVVKMFLEDVGTIYVICEGFLSGVVSRKDLIKSLLGTTDLKKIPIGLIMNRMPNIIMTFPEEFILDAAKKIIEHEIDSLPVVEKIITNEKINYKVVGRISKTNITKVFVELVKIN